MGNQGGPAGDALAEARGVFERADPPGTPFTTSEVAESLDCGRRTAYGRLTTLVDRGELETKKVGARGRVWWRPVPRSANRSADASDDAFEGVQFREFVGSVTDYAIFVLDPAGRVRTWNQGARQLKGYEESDIVGEHFSVFYTESDREARRPERNLAAAAEAGRVEDEGWRVRADGERFWANVVVTAIRDDAGDLRGYTKVTRDMTERHAYEERLRDQRDELDELDRVNTIIREIDQALVTATSRDGIEQAVCDRLADSETYAAAAIGEYDGDRFVPRTRAGGGGGESDDAPDGDDVPNDDPVPDADATPPAVERAGADALRTRTTRTVRASDADDEDGDGDGDEDGRADAGTGRPSRFRSCTTTWSTAS